jgi:hypothetical protein
MNVTPCAGCDGRARGGVDGELVGRGRGLRLRPLILGLSDLHGLCLLFAALKIVQAWRYRQRQTASTIVSFLLNCRRNAGFGVALQPLQFRL